jgi:23S rRNA (guanine2445-N2)-methyltransferase / 23S rRNA (guanine2069-N7)-methyltransferase
VAETFVVTTFKGAEEVLALELRQLGLQRVTSEYGAVRFMGSVDDGLRACLWSRIGSRVLLRLARFEAVSANELYEGVASIPWQDHINANGSLWVDFVGFSREIRNSQFGARKTKDAIVDVLRERCGTRPDVRKEHPDVRVNVHLRHGVATVSVDLSGQAMHFRTPGRLVGEAPLKENLAAALLYLARWPERAKQGEPFVDPMCGSGALAIEAAGIAHGIAPGLTQRQWGFSGWLGCKEERWRELVIQARAQQKSREPCGSTFWAMDQERRAVSMTKTNAKRQGVEGLKVTCQELDELRAPSEQPGMLIMNPPYGQRLEADEDLVGLYRKIGDVLRHQMLGWDAYVLAPMGVLSKSVGLKVRRRHEVFNGPLECRLLEIGIDSRAPKGRVEDKKED